MSDTMMQREAAEAARRCSEQIRYNRAVVEDLAKRLRRLDPPFAATLARGSSAHAAHFGKMLLETGDIAPVVTQAPVIGSIFGASSARFHGVPLFVVSQSGRSPDLLAAGEDARRRGALLVALVNDTNSPLAELADVVVPLHAGTERSVAATKSYIAALVAFTQIAAAWAGDRALQERLEGIGEVLETATGSDWAGAAGRFAGVGAMFVLGRGFSLPIAGEAALKFKETCGLHAEAFSAAEVAHGPMALIGEGSRVLAFGPRDRSARGQRERLEAFAARGAVVLASGLDPTGSDDPIHHLDWHGARDPVLGCIADIQRFYPLAAAIAGHRGIDPDRPAHLSKVTCTR